MTLPFACHRRKDLNNEAWVTEARRRCGFDGPDFKDRFTTIKKKPTDNLEHSVPSSASLNSASSTSSHAADEDDEHAAEASDEEPLDKKPASLNTSTASHGDELSEAEASVEKTDEAGAPDAKPAKAEVLQELPMNLDDIFRDGVFNVRKAHEVRHGVPQPFASVSPVAGHASSWLGGRVMYSIRNALGNGTASVCCLIEVRG